MTRTTDEVIDRFNQAFQERDASLLEDTPATRGVNVTAVAAPGELTDR